MKVLDHGYVELIETRGTDRFIAQTARTSTSTEKSVDEDNRLVTRLIRDEHTSPVEFAGVVLQIKCPIFVARQWMRHRAGTFNEFSGRYSEFPEEYYVPSPDRVQAQSTFNKQGSAETLSGDLPEQCRFIIEQQCKSAYADYKLLLDLGLTRELARSILPVNFYTVFRWQVNLHNLFHFLRLREDPHAQYEIRVYAEAIHDILKEHFPVATAAFEQHIQERITISPELAKLFISLVDSNVGQPRSSELTSFLARFKPKEPVRNQKSADSKCDPGFCDSGVGSGNGSWGK